MYITLYIRRFYQHFIDQSTRVRTAVGELDKILNETLRIYYFVLHFVPSSVQ